MFLSTFRKLAILLSGLCSFQSAIGEIPPLPPTVQSSCQGPPSARMILSCILAKHPDLQLANSAADAQKIQVSSAGAWSNPELSSEIVFGNQYGVKSVSTSTSLTQAFEFGKVSARKNKAIAEQHHLSARALSERESIILKVVIELFTLKHREAQQLTIQEAIETFDRIYVLYRSRGRLSPENSVNANIIELARQDYRLKLSALKAEIDESVRSLQYYSQTNIVDLKKILPQLPKPWPKFNENSEMKNSTISLAIADFEVAEADLSLAHADSFPTINAGPIFETEVEGPERFNSFGIGVSFTLPLWNLNFAARNFASRQRDSAAVSLRTARTKLSVERRNYLIHYNQAIDSLTRASSLETLDKNHKAVESFFSRGVVSPTLVIETHRQILEFMESYQGHELSAIEALWHIYLIDGIGLSGEHL